MSSSTKAVRFHFGPFTRKFERGYYFYCVSVDENREVVHVEPAISRAQAKQLARDVLKLAATFNHSVMIVEREVP